jgi:hypothetical protein
MASEQTTIDVLAQLQATILQQLTDLQTEKSTITEEMKKLQQQLYEKESVITELTLKLRQTQDELHKRIMTDQRVIIIDQKVQQLTKFCELSKLPFSKISVKKTDSGGSSTSGYKPFYYSEQDLAEIDILLKVSILELEKLVTKMLATCHLSRVGHYKSASDFKHYTTGDVTYVTRCGYDYIYTLLEFVDFHTCQHCSIIRDDDPHRIRRRTSVCCKSCSDARLEIAKKQTCR